jgi:hypothetical protein
MTERSRTGGAGQESIGGGDQPEERFETPSGGAIEHHGKGPHPSSHDRPDRPDRPDHDPSAQADGDDGDPASGGRGRSTRKGGKEG